VLALPACSREGPRASVATAGGVALDAADVRAIVAALPADAQTAVRKDKAALERVVRAELLRRALLAEAKAANLDSDAKVAAQLARLRDEALVRLWVQKQAQVSADYPSEEDLKLAYQASTAALTPAPQYRVAQIFIAAPNGVAPAQLATAMRKAADVGRQIPGGDFAALAREHSEHAESASHGGEVGLLPANQMLPEIAAAVRGLDVGGTTGPIKTSQGLHYVKLLERRVAPAPTFDEAREQLRAAMRARRAQELEQAYVTALDERLGVAVDQIALAQLDGEGGEPAAN
jgi:peptidylprolyl isomerase